MDAQALHVLAHVQLPPGLENSGGGAGPPSLKRPSMFEDVQIPPDSHPFPVDAVSL